MDEYHVDIKHAMDLMRVRWGLNKENPTAFSRLKDTGSNLMMCCPFHNESKPSFGIKMEYPYKYNCFSCGSSGTLITLIQHVYECNYYEAMGVLIREFANLQIDLDIDSLFEEDAEIVEGITEADIDRYKGKKHSYITNRGISDYTLYKYEVGYDPDTFSITFPVRDVDGTPLYIVRRSIGSKFYNIPENAPKGVTLYGLNYIRGRTTYCYLVEGMVDVLSCFEAKLPSVGLGGRSLNDTQARLLLNAGIKDIILFLDNDKWGVLGNIQAYKVLEKYPFNIKVATYPERWGIDGIECKHKDPNDLLRAGLLENVKVISYIDFYADVLLSKCLRGN